MKGTKPSLSLKGERTETALASEKRLRPRDTQGPPGALTWPWAPGPSGGWRARASPDVELPHPRETSPSGRLGSRNSPTRGPVRWHRTPTVSRQPWPAPLLVKPLHSLKPPLSSVISPSNRCPFLLVGLSQRVPTARGHAASPSCCRVPRVLEPPSWVPTPRTPLGATPHGEPTPARRFPDAWSYWSEGTPAVQRPHLQTGRDSHLAVSVIWAKGEDTWRRSAARQPPPRSTSLSPSRGTAGGREPLLKATQLPARRPSLPPQLCCPEPGALRGTEKGRSTETVTEDPAPSDPSPAK